MRGISAVSVGCENILKINEKKLTETDLYILGLLETIKALGQQIEELKEEVMKPAGGYGTFGKTSYTYFKPQSIEKLREGPFRVPPILGQSLSSLELLIDKNSD